MGEVNGHSEEIKPKLVNVLRDNKYKFSLYFVVALSTTWYFTGDGLLSLLILLVATIITLTTLQVLFNFTANKKTIEIKIFLLTAGSITALNSLYFIFGYYMNGNSIQLNNDFSILWISFMLISFLITVSLVGVLILATLVQMLEQLWMVSQAKR